MTEMKPVISNHLSATENLETTPLSEGEERFRLLLEASPDGFIMLRSIRNAAGEITDFQIEYTNPVAARGVNRQPEELRDRYLLQLFPDCKTSGIFDRYVKVAETGISTTFETFNDNKELTGWFRNVVVKLNDGIGVSFSDITDRKQAELALQQQQQHFQIALQTAKLGSWEHDLTTGVLTCSAQCKANFGLPPDAEFSHETLFAALHPDDRPVVQAMIARSIAERIDYEVEERCYHPDGSLHWLIVRGQLVYDSQGTPTRLVGVTLDITERKQFEQSLQAANQRIFNILESITDAFVAFDHNWHYTYVNQEAARMLGRSPQELLGQRWQEAFPEVAQQNSVIVQHFERAMTEQTTVRFEAFSLITNCWLDISLFPSSEGLAMYFRDISEQQAALRERVRAEAELRQRETELRLVTNALPVLISFIDAQQCYRFNNQKYEEWFGNPASDVYGKHLREVLGESAYETIRPYVEQVLAGQEVTFESKISYKNRGTRFISATYVPRFDQQGTVEGFVALVSDITQRKQAEETLRQSEERLRIAQQAANAGVWDWNIVTNQVTWSEEYYRLYGLERAITLPSYENWLLSIVQQDRDYADQASQKALVECTDLNIEFRTLHPSRGERWLNAIGQTFYDDNGQPVRMTGIALDITERKQAEAALLKSEERYRRIYDQAIVGISQADLTGLIIEANERFCEIVGRSQTELLTLRMQDITHPDDLPDNLVLFRRMVAEGTSFEIEKRYIRPDGSHVWVRNYVSIVRNAAGQPQHGVAITEDITERKQTELALAKSNQTLRQSEAFNREILESSGDCIKVLSLEGSLLYISPGGQKLLQVDDITSLIGCSWVNFWQEADQPAAQEALKQALIEGVGIFQGYCPTLTGELKCWDVKVTPIKGDNGKIERLLCISRDITERKQAESALRNSAERLSVALTAAKLGDWSWDAQTDVVNFSERAAEIFGISPGPYMTWTQMQNLLHEQDREQARLSVEQAIAQQADYDIEYQVIHPDGSLRWVAAKGRAQYKPAGQVLGMLGVVQDITARKQAEQKLEQLLERESAAREQAETANRIKDEFLAVLSHELRSPLNPILGWSRLLQKSKLDEARTKQALSTIERNAQLQAELIEDLLDVSRILQGKLTLTRHPVHLASTIKAALETVQLAAEAKFIQIEANLDTEMGAVLGDSTRLQQVVWNLLSNAVKFTPAGGRVKVQLSQVDNQAQITVSDTGKGISPDFLPYVFDYFRQADSATTRKFGGLGLGLAIVRHLVELHGGTIQAQSQGEGMGATFTLKLPLMSTQLTIMQDSQLPEPFLGLQGIKILVVDDDTDTRDFVAFLLEQAGARVITAHSALAALEILTQSQPDVLLSDIGMPEMDGYMLMRQVRALPKEQGGQIPAIALTAYAGEIDEKQALKVGFQKHISKPVDPDNLIKSIFSLIGI